MVLGTITGKTSTLGFKFLVEGNAKKFQYVQVPHEDSFALAQIMEIEKDINSTIATCMIIGKRDKDLLVTLQTPPPPGAPVDQANDEFITQTLGLGKKEGAYLGTLNGREEIPVHLDLNKVLSKHVVVLAKTGAGKSYATGVLLEEILDRKIPILIFDPHGEYSTLKFPNSSAKESLDKHGLVAKAYAVNEYSPNVQDVPTARPLKLDNKNLTPSDLLQLLPAKLSNAQLSVLYSAMRSMGKSVNFLDLIMALESEDSNIKYSIINIIDYVNKLNLFSEAPTRLTELVQPGKATIINLKGTPYDIQEIIVYKLASDLFEARKKGNIPPFFMVIEEAQNYCPERSFGEAKSSGIIRRIASEGRKFGISIAIISQRPSRVDKNVISQASTQLILKVTNPHDIKAIANSVEGITQETEKEIKNIPIGTAMVTGIADLPLFVDIRPRKSKHGGESISPLLAESSDDEDTDITKEVESHEGELLPLVQPHTSIGDLKLIHGTDFSTTLIPCKSITLNQGGEDFPILVNLTNNEFIIDPNSGKSTIINFPKLELSPSQQRVFDIALKQGSFKPADLFSKSGLQFSEIYDIINSLTTKGLFTKQGETYTISPTIKNLTNLKQLACYERVDYARVTFDKKLPTTNNGDTLLNLLSRFATITNEKECWFVQYSPKKK